MALTKSERAELKRLQAKAETDDDDTPRRRSTDKPKRSNGESDVVVLRGARADSFLEGLFGTADQDSDDDDTDDDGDDDDDDDEPDDRPPPTPRWFR